MDSPIPKPESDEVVIKVVYAGSNPKDWKIAEFFGVTANQGDDIAGTVHEVGSAVTEFKPGTSDICPPMLPNPNSRVFLRLKEGRASARPDVPIRACVRACVAVLRLPRDC